MTRIQFPFTGSKNEFVPDVELVECTQKEWAEMPENGDPEWSVCLPEPGSTDRLIRAIRLIGPDSARGAAPVLRLVGT